MINKCIFIGNLGRDPELKYTPQGDAVASFSIACTEKFGENKRTEWVNVVAWKKLAEICNQYLQKGSTVYVEGRMQTRSWDDKDGKKHSKVEIVAQTVKFLSKKGESSGADTSGESETPEETTDLEPF